VLSYHVIYPGVIKTESILELVLQESTRPFIKRVFDFFKNDPNQRLDYEEIMKQELSRLTLDTNGLKKEISKTLLNNRKLILFSESQGNLFVSKSIQDFKDGELLETTQGGMVKTGSYHSFEHVVGQVLAATPIDSVVAKHKIVLNDEDIIRWTYVGVPAATFNNFEDPVNDPRHPLDHYVDHFVDGTYLNFYGKDPLDSLAQLREFTLQSVIDVAGKLESNCPKAVINYRVDKLNVSFDATDPLNPEEPNSSDLIYKWDFGDFTSILTQSVLTQHAYPNTGVYTVKLVLEGSDGTVFDELATASKRLSLQETIFGCAYLGKPAVQGALHINSDGTKGGFVDYLANVDKTVYLDPQVQVCGKSSITGGTKISLATTQKTNLFIEDSIITNSIFNLIEREAPGSDGTTIVYRPSGFIRGSYISNSNFEKQVSVNLQYSNVSSSSFQSFETDIRGSNISNSSISLLSPALRTRTFVSNSTFANFSSTSNSFKRLEIWGNTAYEYDQNDVLINVYSIPALSQNVF
jgi:hypothetical protein